MQEGIPYFRQDGSLVVTIENGVRRGPDVATSTTAAETLPLTGGVYDVSCTVDCFIRVGVNVPALTQANGYPLYANNTVPFLVWEGSTIGVISATAGTMRYIKVN